MPAGEVVYGVATNIMGTPGGTIGFYGSTPVARASITQQATTKTTTQLRAELTALQNALHDLGLITIT
jgi:ribonuclease HI